MSGDIKTETLAEIVAEMRDVSKADKYTVKANPKLLSPTVFGKPICAYFAEAADRIEAAAKRECGNAAARREALEKMSDLFERGVICTSYANTAEEMEQIEELYQMAKAALAKPPRNCDRFNTGNPVKDADDAYAEWQRQCEADDMPPSCKVESAFRQWLFAPAAERKGETDAK